MPNWNHIVREHLAALRLPPEREIEIVEEPALRLEAAYEDALAVGLSEAEAEARRMKLFMTGSCWNVTGQTMRLTSRATDRPTLSLIEADGANATKSVRGILFGARLYGPSRSGMFRL